MRVLIVDDNGINRKLLRVTLRSGGHETADAVDGIEALEKLRSGKFDAVVSDILMPRMDGYRFCYEVRRSADLRDLPVIIYSSTYTSDADEHTALSVGADRFIRKPAAAEVILDALTQVTSARHTRRKSASPPAELDALKEYSEGLVRKLEHKNVELEASERRYRELVDFAPIGIYRATREGSFVSVNAAYARLLGYDSPAEVLRLDLRQDIYFDNADRERLIVEIESQRGIATSEVRLKRRDGSPIWVRQATRAIRGSSGTVEFFEDFVHDIQEQKRAVAALRQSEERFRRSFTVSPIGMSLTEARTGRIVDVNERFSRLLGYEREELIGRTTLELGLWVDPNQRTESVEAIEKSLPIREREAELRTKSGEIRHVLGSMEPLEVGEERVLLSVLQDITERERAEQALRQSEERLRLILDTAHEAFVAMDAEGRIVDWNPQAQKAFGWTSEEAIGRKLAETIIPERYREAHARGLANFLRTGEGPILNRWFEIAALNRVGREFPIELMISPMRLGEGYLFNAFLHDISERKAAEEALRASEERYRLLFERNLAGVFRSTLEGQLLDCNDAFARIYGYSSRGEILARPASDLYSDAELRHQLMERISQEGELINYEEQGRRKDGGSVWVLGNYTLVPRAKGDEEILEGTIVDITERKQLQEQLQQAQKMEAIGQLAGGIAHDFNNLLTAILGYSGLLATEVGDQSPLRESIDEIRKAGERAAALTRQLLAFSRKQVLEPKVLDLNALIANLEKMLGRLIGEDILLNTALGRDIGRIRSDAGQIEQVVLNLAVNARDAMPRGGTLTIETQDVDLDEAYAREHVSVRPGSYVMLAVTDTGTGMSAETKSHMFEPFFTTKGQGKGTGLGLATVYGIVKQSGGNVWVYSELGRGTTFKIYLPRVEGEVEAQRAADLKPPVGGAETILLVEDDESVRSLTRRLLAGNGYMVLEAGSAEEALQAARGHPGPIHLLLTDVVMPEIGGSDLASLIGKIRPGIKVLYMSGYTDDAIIRQGLVAEGVSFLQKPFTPATLARKVREVLS